MNDAGLSRDKFLGGRVHAWQPRKGYRAGVDAVFLASAVPAEPGQTALELGCGAGVASLCLSTRVPGVSITGIELQETYAALAARNATENSAEIDVIQADILAMPARLRQTTFDHVFFNPPYFDRRNSVPADDPGRETAFGENAPLSKWFDVAIRRLSRRGTLTVIQRADRLPEILRALDDRVGGTEVLPLASRIGRSAKLVMLRTVKGGKAPFSILPPAVLHDGPRHLFDGNDYVAAIENVLRRGSNFPWPGD